MGQSPDIQRGPQPPAGRVYDATLCAPERRRFLLIAAILASTLGFIDGTVTTIALPAIRSSLGADLAQAQWINTGYMTPLSALILVGGALGDRLGLARVFGIGIALFVAMSLLCAAAPTPGLLIGARLAQGVGAALMVPGSLALISRAYPREERGRAIGIWAAASALTTAAGPIIGGLALTFGGPEMWRAIFAVNLPLGGLALWLLLRNVAADSTRDTARLDLPGALLATLGLGAVSAALIGAQKGGETSWTLALAGGATLLAFLWQERRAPAPMMPLGLFRNAAFSAAQFATFTLYFGLSAVMFFLPMLLIPAWGLTEIEAAAAFAPLSIFISTLSSRFGRLADRTGPGLPIAMGGGTVAVAYGWLAIAVHGGEFWTGVLPPMLLMGLGMSMVVAPLSAAVMSSAGDDQAGIASGINNTVSRIAGLIAVASLGGLATARYLSAQGPLGYGETGTDPAHIAASAAAFASVAWIAAAMSTLSPSSP